MAIFTVDLPHDCNFSNWMKMTKATNNTTDILWLEQTTPEMCCTSNQLRGQYPPATSFAIPRGEECGDSGSGRAIIHLDQSWSAPVYSCDSYDKTCRWWQFQTSIDSPSHFKSYQYLVKLMQSQCSCSPSCDRSLTVAKTSSFPLSFSIGLFQFLTILFEFQDV